MKHQGKILQDRLSLTVKTKLQGFTAFKVNANTMHFVS